MSDSEKNPMAPLWQRIIVGTLAAVASLSVLAQIIVEPGVAEFTALQWFRLVSAAIGIYLFAHIAVRGDLPAWMPRPRKAPGRRVQENRDLY